MSRNQQVKEPSSDKPEDLQPKQEKVFFSLERLKKKSYFLCNGRIMGWFIKMTQIREST